MRPRPASTVRQPAKGDHPVRRLLLAIFLLAVACGSEPTAPASPKPEPPNLAPAAWSTIPGVTLLYTSDTARVEASGYFTDPDGDALTYAAASSNAAVATATVSESAVTLTGTARGTATVIQGLSSPAHTRRAGERYSSSTGLGRCD